MKQAYHKEPYIDHSINFDKTVLPINCQEFIERAEQADIDDPDLYFDHVENLLVNVKNAYAAGMISKQTWRIVEAKYYVHGVRVMETEE